MTYRERRERRDDEDDRQRDDRRYVRDGKHPQDTNDTPTAERSPDEDDRYNDAEGHKKSRRFEDDNDHRQDAVRRRRSYENEDDRESNRRPGVDDTREVRDQSRFQDVGGRRQYAYGRHHSDRDRYRDSDSDHSDRRRRRFQDNADERKGYFNIIIIILTILIGGVILYMVTADLNQSLKSVIAENKMHLEHIIAENKKQHEHDTLLLKENIKIAVYDVIATVEKEMNKREQSYTEKFHKLEILISSLKNENTGLVKHTERADSSRTFGETLGGFAQDTIIGVGSVLMSGVRGIISTIFG